MTKPANFTINSDYPTLKNDGKGSATVTIPSAPVIPGNGQLEYYADITIGSHGSTPVSRISSSKNSNKEYRAQRAFYTRSGVNGGMPTTYIVAAFVYRLNATTLRCQVIILNEYATPTTCESGVETISFTARTFIPPFA